MAPLSIRWRIQAWHAALLALVTAGLLTFVYRHKKVEQTARVDMELSSGMVGMLPLFARLPGQRSPPRGAPPPGVGERFRRHFEATGNYVVVFDEEGAAIHRSPNAPADVPVPEAGMRGNVFRWTGANREIAHSAPGGARVVVGKPGELLHGQLRAFAWELAGFGIVIVALGVTIGSWLVGRTLRPLGEIGRTARQIAEGDWKKRIPPARAAGELGALAAVLNESFGRIEKNYQQQARFTADAAHELGNPVSIVLSQTQHALDRPRSATDYVNALAACQRAGERMRVLTRDLLDLESYESGRATEHRVECDLAEILREAIEATGPLAEERRATIVADLPPVQARVHAGSLGRVVINLLANAIKHNAAGVRIEACLRGTDHEARIEIADNGRGIPGEARPYIFDRFYRVDPGAGAGEGRGLGLAIVKAVVVAHGGGVSVESEPRGGARFVVRLPRA